MTNDTYFGPAGWFSTDDAAADCRQIEAEEFCDYRGEDPDEVIEYCQDQERDQSQYIEVVFHCSGNWYEQDVIDEVEVEKETSKAQVRHNSECPCGKRITCARLLRTI